MKTKNYLFNFIGEIAMIFFLFVGSPLFAQNELDYKVMMGYQGWFNAAGDGSAPNEWRHWFQSQTNPSADQLNIDLWPETSEYTQLYNTNMTYANGSNAKLFSSHDASTTNTHFKWMKDYNVYGVYLQRFLGEINDPRFFQMRNNVLQNVINASATHGRHFSIMYDISGVPDDGNLFNKLKTDWEYLINTYNMTNKPGYVKQEGLPVIAIWGIGFRDRGLKPETFEAIINYFHNTAAPQYRAYIVGGVPGQWRTLDGDSESDVRWRNIYHSLDMVSPWAVGRYGQYNEVDDWKNNRIAPDLADCNTAGNDYMPVIFPGFSWNNMHDGNPNNPLNQIPRRGGTFYWRQAYNAISAGSKFVYVAMFDEVDEGTAMFKVAPNKAATPTNTNIVTLDIDGQNLPSDWYLKLANETQKMLDKTISLTPTIPISPNNNPGGITFTANGNPIFRNIYTADPSAHVWPDGRLYVYPSHDIDPPRGCDLMDKYHVYSTADMVTWTDHGEILSASQVPWGRPEGGFMWAPDCAYKNGTYYFYFPHPSGAGDTWNSTWKIGVATSSSPTSGFTVQGYIPGLESMIDPCVFTDDDGQTYFYYGGGGVCKGGKMKANMVEIDGAMQNMTGLVDFHEASWVHKKNGLYYLSYSDNNATGGNQMRYATSTSPLGPWTYKGIYIDPTGSATNHGSIVEFKGQTYAFYHNSALSGNDWLRSVCVDKVFYNADGTIQKVIQTKEHGTPYGGTARAIPGTIQAEDYDVGGPAVSYADNSPTNEGGQYRTDAVDLGICSEGGFNIGWIASGEWLEYTVNVASAGTYNLSLRAATEQSGTVRVEFNGADKTGNMNVVTTGSWNTYTNVSTNVSLAAGQQIMRIFFTGGAFNLNYVTITSVQAAPVVSSAGTATGTLGQAFSYQIAASNSPTSFGATGLPGGLSVNTSNGLITGTPTTSGTFNVTVTATNSAGTGSKALAITINPAAVTHQIPGTIQTENYSAMFGIQTENTGDTGGGLNVGWTDNNDWMDYNVNVVAAGSYTLNFRVASPNTGGQIQLRNSNGTILATVSTPNTGNWQVYTTVSATVNLPIGTQTLRLFVVTGGFNINWVQFVQTMAPPVVSSAATASGTVGQTFSYQITASNSPAGYGAAGLPSGLTLNTANGLISGTPTAAGTFNATVSATNAGGTGTKAVTITIGNPAGSTPYLGTAWSIPGTIQTENYDDGGEGIAYHDNDVTNSGGQQRTNQGVDVENTGDNIGGTYNVGWTGAGEWLKYTVNVAVTGTYSVTVRVASPNAGKSLRLEIDDAPVATVNIPTTAGWQTYQDVTVTTSNINAGSHKLKIYMITDGFNLNYVTFSTTTLSVPVVSSAGAATATVGQSFSYQITASNSPTSYNATGLPAGLTVSTTSGLISGTPSVSGTFNVNVNAINSAGTGSKAVTMTINPASTVAIYRIKNRWQNTYLYDAGDRVRYATTAPNTTYQWIIEEVGGVKELKNVGTGEYMHLENLQGYVQSTPRTSGWSSSRWTMETVSNGIVRFKNVWQPTYYIHIENLQNQAQYGTIDQSWWSAQWVLESVSGAKVATEDFDLESSVLENAIILSPNPVTTGWLQLQTGAIEGTVNVTITNDLGMNLYSGSEQVENSTLLLNISELKTGVYTLKVQQGGEVIHRRFIVQ